MSAHGLSVTVLRNDAPVAAFDVSQHLVIYNLRDLAERESAVKALRRAADSLEQYDRQAD